MAAHALPAPRGPTLVRASALMLAALCASALACGLVALVFGVSHATPHDAISDSPTAVGSLFLHNAWVAGIPLGLAALGWDRTAGLARVGDSVVMASLAVNGGIVGYAAARSGAELVRYLPHLPFEWGAIALAAGAWLTLRLGATTDRRALLLRTAAFCAAALSVAALLEVYAAPLG